MKRDKWIHCYVNSTRIQQVKQRLRISVLLAGILVSLLFIYRLRNSCKQIYTGG